VPNSHFFPIVTTWSGRIWVTVSIFCVCLVLAQIADRYMPGEDGPLILLSGTVLVALFAGFIAGGFVALISVLRQNYFFQHPRGSFGLHSTDDLFELLLFLSVAVFLGWIGSLLRRAYAQAEAAKKEAERSSQAREDLLAIVSHDLKNPLSAIRLNSELLSKYPGIQEGAAKRSLTSINQSADRAMHLIQDLLDFEKIRTGRLSVDLKPASSKQILEDVCEMMSSIAREKSLRLELLEPASDLFVLCDRERIMQALSNLIGNAIKFTAEGGMIQISCSKSREGALFSVRDSGPGIPEEHQLHLFDRYWQAKTTARFGTGLGLSITKGILEAHHGRIWVESKLGQGSTFSFMIPMHHSANEV